MRTVCRHLMFRRLVAAVLMLDLAVNTLANPHGMTVQSGSATAAVSGSQLTITTSQNAFLNWQSFNIAAGETTIFNQPSSTSIVWNRINDPNPSQIFGSLQANGVVVLLNSSGFYFGPNSFVSAAGLVVSTANCAPPQNSGGAWEFNGPPPLASIVNYGQIKIGSGGSAFLIADRIENHGSIEAPGGTVGLAAGQTVLLSERPDGRGMSMAVTLPQGSVDNEGRLIADGGTIAMNAKVVNQNGFIQANSVRDQNGVIELVASDQLNLGANSQISANGDDSAGGSAGGNVTLKSGNDFSDSVGSQIDVTGGSQGGNGGNVEISAPNVLSLNSGINARAQAGWTAGKLFLDPDFIVLDTSGSGSASGGTVLAIANKGTTLDLNVNSAFANLGVSQIILQAAYDITLAAGTSWNLSQTIGANFGGVTTGQLTLEAGRNIIFGDGASISDANNWSVALYAGVNGFSPTTPTVLPNWGNIYLGQSGSGSIQLAQGSLTMTAGNSINLGSSARLVDSGKGSFNLTAGNSIDLGSGSQVIDDGGTIGLYAQTVNQDGLIQANSAGNQHGIIEVVASDSIALGANSKIIANGDNSASGSAGGQIMLQTAQTFSDVSGSQISADGGANGGDGGRILIYAAQPSVNSLLDVSAQAGSVAGGIFYYPRVDNLTLTADSLAPFAGFSHILFQANDSITLAAGSSWDLGANSGQLTLEAGGDITLGSGAQITDANNWSVTLDAGYSFADHTVQSGQGNIYLGQSGSGLIQLSQATLNLTAGNSINLGSDSLGSDSQLVDNGGTIGLYAQTVNQDGIVQANSVGNQHGTIEFVASEAITLGANSQIIANGDNSASGSAGGQIMLQTAQTFSDVSGSQISVRGGVNGGNGGKILIYAAKAAVQSTLDVSAPAGTAGTSYYYTPYNGLTLTTSTLAPFAGFSSILLQSSGDITLNKNTILNLYTTSGNLTSGQLTLEASGDIMFGNGSKITDANNWSVTLEAGYSLADYAVQSGSGNIYLNNNSGGDTGGGSIQTGSGSINLLAGNDILIGGGFVHTTGGGSITANALAGSVNTGSYAHGYKFYSSDPYIRIDDTYGTGGISTEAGGNVTIHAGLDIISYLPSDSLSGDAGSGAFGPEPGNVTLIADGNETLGIGGNVEGHFVVANGTGSINAGNDAGRVGGDANADGSSPQELALSLISGSWTVNAVNDIYLQEVRNPNGIFNTASVSSPYYHYFDYAPNATVNLTAGNMVQLGDTSTLARASDEDIPLIYAPILNVSAGAGGVTINGGADPYDKLILFPSPQGSLIINTTGGGSLSGSAALNSDGSVGIFNIIVSDSALSQYNVLVNSDTFGLTDYAPTPTHLNSPTPIELNISGNMDNILLGAPEAAQINVVGDMINSRFQGQNLHATDVTSINVGQTAKVNMENMGLLNPATDAGLYVGGNIMNRSEFTMINFNDVLAADPSATPPDLSLLGQANLTGHLYYDTQTGQLTYQGAQIEKDLSTLENLTVQVYVNGQPQFDSQGNPITEKVNLLDPGTGPVTDPSQWGPNAKALSAEYTLLGAVPTTLGTGYQLGGGGQFNINACNVDLGSTPGIVSVGSAYNPALAQYFTRGADINVNLTGNLDMFSTTISSMAGGAISVYAGGTINVGASTFIGNNSNPRGIFTSAMSDVTVIAVGDINVNGSRIAAYDGGNVTVESLNGNVNAGSGGSGFVRVDEYSVVNGAVVSTSATIPGSGILATTFPDSPNTVGNILVETPNGDVNASSGGIVQLPFNNVASGNATVTVLAGEDANGNILSPGRNIDASGSGVIGSTVTLKASGDIIGAIFARDNLDINAVQNVSVTALSEGTATVNAGETLSGTIIGVGGINASGASVDASLLSNNSISGDTSGQSGLAQGTAANSASQSLQSEDATKPAETSDEAADDEMKKKKGKEIVVAQKAGRVTVILPPKPQARVQPSQTRTLEPRT